MISEAEILRRREEYFALETEQEKADYLWEFRHGGAVLRLSPFQYPKCQPRHKRCPICGGSGEKQRISRGGTVGDYDFVIECRSCGRKTERRWSAWLAWRDWDDGKVDAIDGQMTIFDFIGGEQ